MANMQTVISEVTDESKKSQLTERLQKRDEERIRNAQQRKGVKEDAVVVEETGKFFNDQFTRVREDIERRLSNITSSDIISATKQFDDLVPDLQKLQKFLTDSTRFLSAYELQKAQSSINQLKVAIDAKRKEVEPKKKFAFKSEKKKAATQTNTVPASDTNATEPKLSEAVASAVVEDSEPNETGFSFRHNETLLLTGCDIDSKDVLLSSLNGCRVELRGAPSTIHMSALRDCHVLCGPTSGSVFIDDSVGCTFVVACHQLRVHRTTDAGFYLHVTSRAIIEDCSAVRFAPYNWTYPDLEKDFSKSSLDRLRNNWNAVDDFNWLAADTPSPNWQVMQESQRVTSWTDNGN